MTEPLEHSTRHRRKGGTPRAADRLLIEERRERVAALVLSGASYRQIAALLDVSRHTVGNDVAALRRAWREQYARDYDAIVSEEAAKLDALERKWFPVALSSSEDAAPATTLLLRVFERRSRLMGLDAPTKVQASMTVSTTTPLDDEIAGLLAKMAEHEQSR